MVCEIQCIAAFFTEEHDASLEKLFYWMFWGVIIWIYTKAFAFEKSISHVMTVGVFSADVASSFFCHIDQQVITILTVCAIDHAFLLFVMSYILLPYQT